jgi:hypothetical protein
LWLLCINLKIILTLKLALQDQNNYNFAVYENHPAIGGYFPHPDGGENIISGSLYCRVF